MTLPLQLHQVVLRYGRAEAIRGISGGLSPGVTLLTGPNGAGKSSLLRLLATILPPAAGRITWRGAPLDQSLIPYRRRLGYLPQREAAYPEMRLSQFLAYVATLKGIPNHLYLRRQDWLLQALGLAAMKAEPIGLLSGGQARLVSIAQALLNDPEVLLLDEPFEGLDLESRQRVCALLHRPGRITLLASHRTELTLPHLVAEWHLAQGRLQSHPVNALTLGLV